jgi:hypothetical protein
MIILVAGIACFTAAPAEADDTAPCPAGTIRVVITRFCFGGLLGPETCQDITACKRIVFQVPHKPLRLYTPPPPPGPPKVPVLRGHPVLKLR